MTNRRTILRVVAVALLALCLPALAAAQYRRDRDYGRNGGYYGGYDYRSLRDVARRVHDRSKDFQRHVDSALDRSRADGTRREDRINDMARDFRNAASDFKDRVGDGRNSNRGEREAQRLIQIGSQIDRFVARARLDSRTLNDWAQIRQDLRLIANAYGYGYGGYDDGYYRRDDDYRRNDRNRRRNDVPWWQRIQIP